MNTRRTLPTKTRRIAAFSLVEVLVAMLVLGVAVAGLAQGITTALRSHKDSEFQTTAAFLAAGRIELLRAELILPEGVTEGRGEAGLAAYQWKETVSPTKVEGLYEVVVEVRHAPESAPLYELRTLVFDPPAGSLTNRPAADSKSARKRAASRNDR